MEITIINSFWTVICLTTSSILILLAVLVTRSKINSINEFRQAQAKAKGTLAKSNTPECKSKIRLLAIIALVCILGMVLSVTILFLQIMTNFTYLYKLTISVAIVFFTVGTSAGLLMQREINRRL
jgi:hypothetical protein